MLHALYFLLPTTRYTSPVAALSDSALNFGGNPSSSAYEACRCAVPHYQLPRCIYARHTDGCTRAQSVTCWSCIAFCALLYSTQLAPYVRSTRRCAPSYARIRRWSYTTSRACAPPCSTRRSVVIMVAVHPSHAVAIRLRSTRGDVLPSVYRARRSTPHERRQRHYNISHISTRTIPTNHHTDAHRLQAFLCSTSRTPSPTARGLSSGGPVTR